MRGGQRRLGRGLGRYGVGLLGSDNRSPDGGEHVGRLALGLSGRDGAALRVLLVLLVDGTTAERHAATATTNTSSAVKAAKLVSSLKNELM